MAHLQVEFEKILSSPTQRPGNALLKWIFPPRKIEQMFWIIPELFAAVEWARYRVNNRFHFGNYVNRELASFSLFPNHLFAFGNMDAIKDRIRSLGTSLSSHDNLVTPDGRIDLSHSSKESFGHLSHRLNLQRQQKQNECTDITKYTKPAYRIIMASTNQFSRCLRTPIIAMQRLSLHF